MADTRETLLGEMEALFARYLVIGTEWEGQQIMVTGFVFKVTAQLFEEGNTHRLNAWGCPADQDTHMTLGLALGLGQNAESWYFDVTDGVDLEEDTND